MHYLKGHWILAYDVLLNWCCLTILCCGTACRYGRAEGFHTKIRSCKWNCCKLVSYTALII